MGCRRGSVERRILRGRADAGGRRKCRGSLRRHRRSCRRRRRRHLHPRKRRWSYVYRRPRWKHSSRHNGGRWFRLGRNLGCKRRSNDRRRNRFLRGRCCRCVDWRLRFFLFSCGNKIGDLLDSWDVSRNLRGRAHWSDDRCFRRLLRDRRNRNLYLLRLGMNRRAHRMRRFVGRLCDWGRRRYLPFQLQQFTMQGIVLLGVEFGQIP